jgi:hypothetical protein
MIGDELFICFPMTNVNLDAVEPYVLALYRCLLQRDPDAFGWNKWCTFLGRAGLHGFKEALAAFTASDEFKNLHAVTARENCLERLGSFDFDSLDIDILSSLFEKTASCWRGAASAPEEIYWSVLTDDQFRGVLSQDVVNGFLATGEYDIQRIKRICEIIDFRFDGCQEYLEYGCGVGRLVVNLPGSVKK